MTVYRLSKDPIFPPPSEAEPSGLLAVGGDLTPERLVNAYASGIFPWYGPGEPICWFSPDPRCVILPAAFHQSRSLRKARRRFQVSLDAAFHAVVEACATTARPGQPGTWITSEMKLAYQALHRLGLAHSVEVWREGQLVGGLYGVSLGTAFFGESMFHLERDASKVALATLMDHMIAQGLELLDCQLPTPHLMSLGAERWPRTKFLLSLGEAMVTATLQGSWHLRPPLNERS